MVDGQTLGRHTQFWENEVSMRDQRIRVLEQQAAQFNQLIHGLKTGVISWERVVTLETGEIQLLPEPPAMPEVAEPSSCDSTMSESMEELAASKKETTAKAETVKEKEAVGAGSNG